MRHRQQIFDHPTQLNRLSTLPLFRRAGDGRVQLAGTIGEHPERGRWEKELNRHYFACGCAAGGKGLLLGLIGGAGYSLWKYFGGDWSLLRLALITLAVAVATSAVGKLIGLWSAQGRLRKTIIEIQDQWQVSPGKTEDSVCG